MLLGVYDTLSDFAEVDDDDLTLTQNLPKRSNTPFGKAVFDWIFNCFSVVHGDKIYLLKGNNDRG